MIEFNLNVFLKFVFFCLDGAETATLRHIFSDAAYYLIKSGNEENVSLAKAKVKIDQDA